VVAATSAKRSVDPTLTGRTALVIEDHPDSRDLLVSVLRSLRAHVVIARNLAEAERTMMLARVHLVICDMKLPDGTGLDFVHWLRSQREPVATTPCMAVTGYDRFFPADKVIGVDAYMVKPIDFDKFCSIAVELGNRDPGGAKRR
jgi:CheY-like chemotaxis protein